MSQTPSTRRGSGKAEIQAGKTIINPSGVNISVHPDAERLADTIRRGDSNIAWHERYIRLLHGERAEGMILWARERAEALGPAVRQPSEPPTVRIDYASSTSLPAPRKTRRHRKGDEPWGCHPALAAALDGEQ